MKSREVAKLNPRGLTTTSPKEHDMQEPMGMLPLNSGAQGKGARGKLAIHLTIHISFKRFLYLVLLIKQNKTDSHFQDNIIIPKEQRRKFKM